MISITSLLESGSANRSWIQSNIFTDDREFQSLTRMREDIYPQMGQRKDATMDLIDALACQENATSVTDLSCFPQFKRKYSSIRDGIHYMVQANEKVKSKILDWSLAATPELKIKNYSFSVFGVDSTPMPHPNANCLEDRSIIHDASNNVTGKPINIGHEYSAIVSITEDRSWVCPVKIDRIPTNESPAPFGIKQAVQVNSVLDDQKHAIFIMDSRYNTAPCRVIARKEFDHVKNTPIFIVRSACNRQYYLPADVVPKGKRKRGRPPIFGKIVNPKKPECSSPPDKAVVVAKNDEGAISIQVWRKVISGQKGLPPDRDPSSLIVVREYKADGSLKYLRPLVLRVFLPEDTQFDHSEAAWLYLYRFAIEHFFKSMKSLLLFGKYQSPELSHQEAFVTIAHLAYLQWFFAKNSGEISWTIKPWQRYPLSNPIGRKLSPSHVQKGFAKVLSLTGTPSVYRPPRNIPQGRQLGEVVGKRKKQLVIRKSGVTSKPKEKNEAKSMSSTTRESAVKVGVDNLTEEQDTHTPQNKLLLLFFILLSLIIPTRTSNQICTSFIIFPILMKSELVQKISNQREITKIGKKIKQVHGPPGKNSFFLV